MVIFVKTAKNINEVNHTFDNSCDIVRSTMKEIIINNAISNYDEWVDWALRSCLDEIPTPFSFSYPNGYSLNLTPNFFNLRIPNRFGIGIKYNTYKSLYEVSITFYNDQKLIENTEEYRSMINNEWTLMDYKKK